MPTAPAPREEVRLDGPSASAGRARPLPAALAAPAFVPLWSSGILGGALAIRHGPPFAVTGLRFAAAALLLALLAPAWRAPWPRSAALGHAAAVGLLLQRAHDAGIYAGISLGMPAGVAGLVVGLIPVATAIGAVPVLHEPLTRRRARVALLGAAAARLAVRSKLGAGEVDATIWLAALAGGAGGRCGGSASAWMGRTWARPRCRTWRARR